MKINRTIIIIIVVLSFILATAFGVYSFNKAAKMIKLPLHGQVGAFFMTGTDAQPFDSIHLYGKVWIVNFFSTSCKDDCSKVNEQMASLSRTFEQVPGVKLVSVTLEPSNDTPEVLLDYANQFVGGKDNWFFLTGTRTDILRLAKEQLKLASITESAAERQRITLVDRSGLIRGYYNGSDQEAVNQLFKDASLLLKDRF